MKAKIITFTILAFILIGMLAYLAYDTYPGGLFGTATPTIADTATPTWTVTSTAPQTSTLVFTFTQ